MYMYIFMYDVSVVVKNHFFSSPFIKIIHQNGTLCILIFFSFFYISVCLMPQVSHSRVSELCKKLSHLTMNFVFLLKLFASLCHLLMHVDYNGNFKDHFIEYFWILFHTCNHHYILKIYKMLYICIYMLYVLSRVGNLDWKEIAHTVMHIFIVHNLGLTLDRFRGNKT